MLIARTAISAASADGLLYTMGGECALAEPQDDTMYLRSLERYDPVMKEWTRLSDMKVARSFLAAVSVGGYLYALGETLECVKWYVYDFKVYIGQITSK